MTGYKDKKQSLIGHGKFQRANLARTGFWKWNRSYDWLISVKECGSVVSSPFFGGALRDIPKNGCGHGGEDYSNTGLPIDNTNLWAGITSFRRLPRLLSLSFSPTTNFTSLKRSLLTKINLLLSLTAGLIVVCQFSRTTDIVSVLVGVQMSWITWKGRFRQKFKTDSKDDRVKMTLSRSETVWTDILS